MLSLLGPCPFSFSHADVVCLPLPILLGVQVLPQFLFRLWKHDLAFLYQVQGDSVKVGNILALLQCFRPLGTAVPVVLSRGQCEGNSICHRQKVIYLS